MSENEQTEKGFFKWTKKVITAEKSSLTSFQVCAAPKVGRNTQHICNVESLEDMDNFKKDQFSLLGLC